MMAKTRVKQDAAVYPVPQNEMEVRGNIKKIGDHQRQRDRIEADMNDAIIKLKEDYANQAAPHNKAIELYSKGVQTYCEAHREELTNHGKKKSADFGTGDVQWRMRPPSVRIKGVDDVIEALKALKLTRFLRSKLEINKPAILEDQEAVQHIKGISISQVEDFVIKPSETELEEVA